MKFGGVCTENCYVCFWGGASDHQIRFNKPLFSNTSRDAPESGGGGGGGVMLKF